MPDPIELPTVEILRLQPGDVVVATLARSIPINEVEDILAQLKKRFPGNEVIAVDGLQLSVVRPEETAP